MGRYLKRVFVVLVLVVGGMIATQAAALADPPPVVGPGPNPFLCPIVGDAVRDVADEANGDNGVSAIAPDAGVSIVPGNNQAGAKANSMSYNSDPPEAGNTPGSSPDFSPIWPSG